MRVWLLRTKLWLFICIVCLKQASLEARTGQSGLPKAIVSDARKKDLLPVFKQLEISGQEAIVRLILAETMASHCLALEEGHRVQIETIMKGIARVIRNRVGHRENKKELGVVFAQNQFNSSLAQYRCSEIKGFLNPQAFKGRVPGLKVEQLWQMAHRAYEAAWSETIFERNADSVKNYYLHQHHRRGDCKFNPPRWVDESKEIKLSGSQQLVQSVRHCIGFYLLNQ